MNILEKTSQQVWKNCQRSHLRRHYQESSKKKKKQVHLGWENGLTISGLYTLFSGTQHVCCFTIQSHRNHNEQTWTISNFLIIVQVTHMQKIRCKKYDIQHPLTLHASCFMSWCSQCKNPTFTSLLPRMASPRQAINKIEITNPYSFNTPQICCYLSC